MKQSIIEFGQLNDAQKEEAVDLFLYGFGHFMTFSKDKALKKRLFLEIFSPNLFLCYVEDDKVLGLMGLGTNKVRPIDFKKEICQKCFGKFIGSIISKQMNSVFQKPVVKGDKELYLDTLVTHPDCRNKGIGTTLINKACSFGNYDSIITEVFSKNENALKFYKKNGFIIKKKNKLSLMRIMGSGYPITMIKYL
jgi:ribosomal protein S18 acetylase RimI-like enzyme